MKVVVFPTVLVFTFIVGCAPLTPLIDSRQQDTDRFSLAAVQGQVKKGVTSKGEVLKLLGSPNLISRDRSGKEIHIWDKRSSESERSVGFGASVTIQNERTITIAITYNSKDIVEDVTYRATSF